MQPRDTVAPCILAAALVLCCVPTARATQLKSTPQFWCDVLGPIGTACSVYNISTPVDTDICVAVAAELPLMDCNETYPAPAVPGPEPGAISTLLLMEFGEAELLDPELISGEDPFGHTLCDLLREQYEQYCGEGTGSALCDTISARFSSRCPTEPDEDSSNSLTLENAVEIAFGLLVYFVASAVLQYKQFSYLPEAAAAVLIGAACGGAMWLLQGGFSCTFDNEFFFDLLLPFIILEAGLCVDKRMLASNMGTILSFASIGTLWSAFAVGGMLFAGSEWLGQGLPLLECLIFGTLISSIDPIATLSVFSTFGVDKSLYILVFGESMLNDGVAVVLFQALVNLLGRQVDAAAIGTLVWEFGQNMLGSVLCAVVASLLSSWLFKRFHGRVVSHDCEVLLVLLAALIPYYVCERLGWSGIVSIMAAGVLMDVYTLKNLSSSARVSVMSFVQLASSVSNGIIFLYMGVQIVGNSSQFSINVPLGLLCVLICLLGRLWVFPLSWLCNRFRPPGYQVPCTHQGVLFFSGLRGVVSYALVTSVPAYVSVTHQGSHHRPALMGLTIFVICFKMFVFGGLTLPVLKALSIPLGDSAQELADRTLHQHKQSSSSEAPPRAQSCVSADKLSCGSSESFFQVDAMGNLEPRHWLHTQYLAPLLLVGKQPPPNPDLEGGQGCCGPAEQQQQGGGFESREDQEWFEVYRRRPVGNRSTRTARQFYTEAHSSEPGDRHGAAHRRMTRTHDPALYHEHQSWETHQRLSLQ